MIIVHAVVEAAGGAAGPHLARAELAPGAPFPPGTLWIDLVRPAPLEDRRIEAHLGISIPTREEMQDIEPSEVIYSEDGAHFLGARLLWRANTDDPALASVTFILKGNVLVTVRYDEPYAFAMFANRAAKPGGCGTTAETVMAGLVDAIIDRAADVLQGAGTRIDQISHDIFVTERKQARRGRAYQATFRALGLLGDLVSKQRESLVSIERVLLSLTVSYRAARLPAELREQVRSTLRDLQSLEEHATFLSGKIQFLLEATLGLVSIEQNDIIKLFSVVAVVFMPPTLIASIYGMNFVAMPELKWGLGYPLALVMMVAAAVLPIVFFRWKKWL